MYMEAWFQVLSYGSQRCLILTCLMFNIRCRLQWEYLDLNIVNGHISKRVNKRVIMCMFSTCCQSSSVGCLCIKIRVQFHWFSCREREIRCHLHTWPST